MNNPIKEIVSFNENANLLNDGYNDYLESSFQIEEALEGIDTTALAGALGDPAASPKEISRMLLSMCELSNPVSDVDRLDKACDAVVFAVGSMAKLGLDPHQITRSLNVVMKANNTKLNMARDEHGKLTKPEDFVGPEEELQEILDERKE